MSKKDYTRGFNDGVIDGRIDVIERLEMLKDEIEAYEMSIEEVIQLLKDEIEF